MDQPTRQSARIAGDRAESLMTRADRDEGGDGTVPKLSAALSGTEDARTFVPQKHGSLQNQDAMLDHLKGVLQSLHDIRVDDLRSSVTSWFSHRGDDLYLDGEPVVCEIGARSAFGADTLPEVTARLTVTARSTGVPVVDREVAVPREPRTFDLGPLPPAPTTWSSGRAPTPRRCPTCSWSRAPRVRTAAGQAEAVVGDGPTALPTVSPPGAVSLLTGPDGAAPCRHRPRPSGRRGGTA
ncbi:hypothetical protein [Streptomyces sp. NPDC008265]|uniref:hypothetical protein n=1 Tax=Streptomyces sp. NPDC008265 TaxID=3364824 RepID=UPI0036EFA76B